MEEYGFTCDDCGNTEIMCVCTDEEIEARFALLKPIDTSSLKTSIATMERIESEL